jgi:hypothetical protein
MTNMFHIKNKISCYLDSFLSYHKTKRTGQITYILVRKEEEAKEKTGIVVRLTIGINLFNYAQK